MPYTKSKTLAERAAWDFIEREGAGLELAVVNPVGVFGPVLGPDYATSILLVQRMMDGALPGLPRMCFGVVDVRDVADLHLRAMTNPAAKGERFLAVAGDFMWMIEIAQDAEGAAGRCGEARADAAVAGLAGAAGALQGSGGEADYSGTGQVEERHEREGAAGAGVDAAFARRQRGGDGGEHGRSGAAEERE